MGRSSKFGRINQLKKMLSGALLILTLGCASVFKQKPLLPRDNLKVAVLPLTARGPAISAGLGHVTADRLTTLLFRDRKIPVVDRSQVNDCLETADIDNVYFLSRDQLTQIADTLTASVVVLGLIENSPPGPAVSQERATVGITLRFIDAKNGEVLTILHAEKEGKSAVQAIVRPLLAELVKGL